MLDLRTIPLRSPSSSRPAQQPARPSLSQSSCLLNPPPRRGAPTTTPYPHSRPEACPPTPPLPSRPRRLACCSAAAVGHSCLDCPPAWAPLLPCPTGPRRACERARAPARSPSQRALRLRLTSIAVLPACFISAQPPACFRTPHSSRLNATRIGARSTLQHLWVTAPPRAAPQAGQGIPIALGSIAAHTSCRL